MDSIDNKQMLQSMIDAQYLILEAEQTLYASLQAQKAALVATASTNPLIPVDPVVRERHGDLGGSSYTIETVNKQLTDSAKRLADLNKELKDLMALQNARFPRIQIGLCHGLRP